MGIAEGFEFALTPELLLYNDFVVRREVMELVPWPCALGGVDARPLWRNVVWEQTITHAVEARLPIKDLIRDAYDGETKNLRIAGAVLTGHPLRDLHGEIAAVLVIVGLDQLGIDLVDHLETAVAVAEMGRFVYANQTANLFWNRVLTDCPWNQVAGLPTWAAVSRLPVHRSRLSTMVRGRRVEIHRAGTQVVLEVLPNADDSGAALDREVMSRALHALKNSLAVASGFLELAQGKQEQMGPAPDLDRYLAKSRNALGQLDRILVGIACLTQPPMPRRDYYGLTYLAQEAWTSLLQELELHGPELVVEQEATLYVDAELLREVLQQIFKNSIEAAREQGRSEAIAISVGVEMAPGTMTLVVRDESGGVPNVASLERHPSFVSRKPMAAGVGLLIARELVKAHGGQLEFKVGDGGVTALIHLPILEEHRGH